MEMKPDITKKEHYEEAKKLYDEIFQIRLKNSFSRGEYLDELQPKLQEIVDLLGQVFDYNYGKMIYDKEPRNYYKDYCFDMQVRGVVSQFILGKDYFFALDYGLDLDKFYKKNYNKPTHFDTNDEELSILYLRMFAIAGAYAGLLKEAIENNKEEFDKVIANPTEDNRMKTPNGYVDDFNGDGKTINFQDIGWSR